MSRSLDLALDDDDKDLSLSDEDDLLKGIPIGAVVLGVVACAFVVVGFITFIAGIAAFEQAKSDVSEGKFVGPDGGLIALHWVLMFMFGLFVPAIIGLYRYECVKPKRRMIPLIILGVLTAVVYIIYLVLYFKSNEYTASANAMAHDQWYEWQERIRAAAPTFVFTADGRSNSRTCSMDDELIVRAANWTDRSEFPEINATDAAVARFDPRLIVTPTLDAELALVAVESAIRECAWLRQPRDISWTIERAANVDGFINAMFITETGELPSKLSHGSAIVAGIFAQGLFHAYQVDTIPSLPGAVIKDDVNIVQAPPVCAELFFSCWSSGSRSRTRTW